MHKIEYGFLFFLNFYFQLKRKPRKIVFKAGMVMDDRDKGIWMNEV